MCRLTFTDAYDSIQVVERSSRVRLTSDGQLSVRVRGLLITAGALGNGEPVPDAVIDTTATVSMVHAALTCGGPGGGVPFTITPTDPGPLSPCWSASVRRQSRGPGSQRRSCRRADGAHAQGRGGVERPGDRLPGLVDKALEV